jgi:cysteine desulfurase / selenocysteine lyase
MMPFDVAALRAEFPILSREIYGKPLVYLDNAASAQKPRAVIHEMTRVMETSYANVHRGLHYLANEATQIFEDAREDVRSFLNAAQSEEIIFTRSATQGYNLIASCFGQLAPEQGGIGEGDEILLSVMEHHSNIVPWHYLRERKGAVLRWVPVDDAGNLDLAAYEKLFSPRTKMVAITHMSNVLGTLTPAKDIVRIAHEHGVPVLLDGAQSAVHCAIDVQDLDCDFYVFTGHKVYGPTGIGVLYGKKAWLERLPPYEGGGEMIREVTQDTVTYNDPPHRFEPGTPPIIEAAGLAAALRFLKCIGSEAIAAHEQDLRHYAESKLRARNSLEIHGAAQERGAIFSFTLKGAHAHDVATILDRYGIAVRAGTHCAMPLMRHLGVTATCRASFALYNTREEVDLLLEGLQKAETLLG